MLVNSTVQRNGCQAPPEHLLDPCSCFSVPCGIYGANAVAVHRKVSGYLSLPDRQIFHPKT